MYMITIRLHNIHARSMGHCNCILFVLFFFYLRQFTRNLDTFDWGSTDRISNFINVHRHVHNILYVFFICCVIFSVIPVVIFAKLQLKL